MRANYVFAALFGLTLMTTCAKAAKCNCQCTFNYSPVCAVDSSGVEETYPSKCAFECYKCTHGKDLQIRKQGECDEKSNLPTVRSEKQKSSPGKCNCQCPFNYAPVCAVDSKGVEETYPNQCSFECYRCTQGKDLRIKKQGECSERNTVRPPRPTSNTGAQRNPPGKCNCQCPFNYAPVCAVDSKGVEETYPNQCSFECYKCTHGKDLRIKKQGECSERNTARPPRPTSNTGAQRNPPGKCNCQCPANYAPVCAVDLRGEEETYPNECSFNCYKCTHGKGLVIRKQGKCDDNTARQNQNSGPKDSISIMKCKCECGSNYTPICAVNSKGAQRTFANRCSLDCSNCLRNEDFVWRRQGECQTSAMFPARAKTRA